MSRRVMGLILLAMLVLGCSEPPAAPEYATGEFRIDGTVTHANIYYQAFNGAGINVLYNVVLPWSRMFAGVQSGDDFFLAAQGNDAGVPALSVEVLVDGVQVAFDTTSAEFGYVAVYGQAP